MILINLRKASSRYLSLGFASFRQHLQKAERSAGDEKAALKWDEVRDMIRLHYSPDLPWRGPK
jgi:hypothetical protein